MKLARIFGLSLVAAIQILASQGEFHFENLHSTNKTVTAHGPIYSMSDDGWGLRFVQQHHPVRTRLGETRTYILWALQ